MMGREPVPALSRIQGTRIASTPAALDAATWPQGALVFRLAPDEAFVVAVVSPDAIADPHAIVEPDAGVVGVWLSAEEAADVLAHHCEWEAPQHRPAFAQGAVGGLATKLWFEDDRVLFAVPAPYASDLEMLIG
ncbi:MAG: hypothetical protein HC853_11775 [Anaerolineae bacterium]|nr:hypothetical protein [Anaerolineae bacterium]